MNPVFSGVGAALVTIFGPGGEVDVAATAGLAADLAAIGLQALVVAGSTGEAPSLSESERVALIGAVREAVPEEISVIAGTGAPSTRQAVALTRHAVDAGADAVLVLSPIRAVDPRPYYAAVAQAAIDKPVLAYHYPAMSPPGITPGQLEDLPVVGIKDSSGDPNRLLELVATYPGHTYVGSSALICAAGAIGATGAILALANARPEDCLAAFEGDGDAQRRLAGPHRGLAPFPAGIKAQVAERWGLPGTTRMG